MRCAPVCLAVVSLVWVVSVASAQYDGYVDADSADIADDALVGVDAADVADVTEALAERSSPAWNGRGGRRAAFALLEFVDGYRTSARVTAGARGVAVAGRRTADGSAGWLHARGQRWLEQVVVGGLRVQCGEGLVLGATRSRFARTSVAPSPGITVGPSLSLYRPLRGMGVSVRHGAERVTAVAWRVADGDAGRWLSVERGSESGALAVSMGVLVDAASGGERAAVSFAGARARGGHRLGGEVARLGDATMALVRTTVAAAGAWTAEVFGGVAADASGGVARIDDDTARERGAALHRRGEWGGWSTTVSVSTVTRRGNDGERLRRRLDCRGVYASPAGLRYDVSARYDHDTETDITSPPSIPGMTTTRADRGRIRGCVDVPAGPALSFRYLAEARLEASSPPGVVSGLVVRWEAPRIDLRVSVTNFALAREGGYVARPGIAGYETVSAVGRRSSDAAARAAIRLGGGVDLTVYAGVPWERKPRYLAALRWSL